MSIDRSISPDDALKKFSAMLPGQLIYQHMSTVGVKDVLTFMLKKGITKESVAEMILSLQATQNVVEDVARIRGIELPMLITPSTPSRQAPPQERN